MRNYLLAFLSLLSLFSYGQKGIFIPFKLIVIKPDTAIIDISLKGDIDSVQFAYIKRYYQSIKQLEQIVDSKNFPDDTAFIATQEKMKTDIVEAKAMEAQIKNFKYYESLSAFSTEFYNFYFNEYEPFSTIVELPNQKTDIASTE